MKNPNDPLSPVHEIKKTHAFFSLAPKMEKQIFFPPWFMR
jgi:hypothetical protein